MQAPQGHSYEPDCCHEKTRSVADRKTEMCSIFDVYDKCVHKGV